MRRMGFQESGQRIPRVTSSSVPCVSLLSGIQQCPEWYRGFNFYTIRRALAQGV